MLSVIILSVVMIGVVILRVVTLCIIIADDNEPKITNIVSQSLSETTDASSDVYCQSMIIIQKDHALFM